MAQKNRETLKDYFETGKKPTEAQFSDLLDSVVLHGSDQLYIKSNGNVGVGVSNPQAKLHIPSSDASLSSGGGLLIGAKTSANMVFDNNDIQARSNGNTAKLSLQRSGGDIDFFQGKGASKTITFKDGKIGIGEDNPAVRLHIKSSLDATYSDNSGAMVIGDLNGANVVFDNNEIMARDNGEPAVLRLQQSGGDLLIGQTVDKPEVAIGGNTNGHTLSVMSEDASTLEIRAKNSAPSGQTDNRLSRLEFTMHNKTAFAWESSNSKLHFRSKTPNGNWITRLTIDAAANIFPSTNNMGNLGTSTRRFRRFYSIYPLNTSSDGRMKTDVANSAAGLSEVMKLRPVDFKWKESGEESKGFIAQELQKILPGMVEGEGDEMLSVNYQELLPVLVKAIQEQQKQIEELKNAKS